MGRPRATIVFCIATLVPLVLALGPATADAGAPANQGPGPRALVGHGLLRQQWLGGVSHRAEPTGARLAMGPRSGPPGTLVRVRGTGFGAGERVKLTFVDPVAGKTTLFRVFAARFTVPEDATQGTKRVKARGSVSGSVAKRRFIVT